MILFAEKKQSLVQTYFQKCCNIKNLYCQSKINLSVKVNTSCDNELN